MKRLRDSLHSGLPTMFDSSSLRSYITPAPCPSSDSFHPIVDALKACDSSRLIFPRSWASQLLSPHSLICALASPLFISRRQRVSCARARGPHEANSSALHHPTPAARFFFSFATTSSFSIRLHHRICFHFRPEVDSCVVWISMQRKATEGTNSSYMFLLSVQA